MFNIPSSKRLRRICPSLTNQSIYLVMGCPNNKGMCQVRVLQKVSKTKTVGALVWKSFTHHAEYMVNTEIAYRRYWTSINPSRVGKLYPSYSCSKPYTTQQWTASQLWWGTGCSQAQDSDHGQQGCHRGSRRHRGLNRTAVSIPSGKLTQLWKQLKQHI